MTKAVFMNVKKEGEIQRVYNQPRMKKILDTYEVYPEVLLPTELEKAKDFLAETELIFSTWGMPRIMEEDIKKYFPKLKAVMYAAGSVKHFATQMLNCGVKVCSAVSLNAIPVAEYVFAQIILANKGLWGLLNRPVDERGAYSDQFPCNYGATVGLIGMGNIGRMVAKKLQTLDVEVLVYDPYFDKTLEKEYRVTKVENLKEIFERADVISNHLPDIPELFGILTKEYFSVMKPYATFINTGRGREVVEEDLIAALTEVPTRTAVLDVTFPEPTLPDSPFRTMPNVILTPHIAGSKGGEIYRMADQMIEEAERVISGEELQYAVDAATLARMA